MLSILASVFRCIPSSAVRLTALLALIASLSACEGGHVTLELSADKPADTTLQLVQVTISGVTLTDDAGGQTNITLDKALPVDLLRYDSTAFKLFDAANLDAGTYTKIQLRFATDRDTDNFIIDSSGQHPLTVNAGDSTETIDLKVKKTGKTYTLDMRMDLRLSLSLEGSDRLLQPVLRAAKDSKAASIAGDVSDNTVSASSCRDGRAKGVGVTIYAFEGKDVAADDYDTANPNPIATAPVLSNGSNSWTYVLRTLPPGDYTVTITCDGDKEDPRTDDSIDFGEGHNISLDDGDNKTNVDF